MPKLKLRPIAYGTGLTFSTDGKLRIEPIRTKYDYEILIWETKAGWLIRRNQHTRHCLNASGHWDEVPSERCRYASLEEASDWLRQCAERSE